MQSSGLPDSFRVPFSDLAQFSPLFSDYRDYTSELEDYFAGDFRKTESFEQVASKTLRVARDRKLLADVLIAQNERWGLDDDARANIERLRRDDSVAIVTGQQLGFFLSPLYIPYKTLTTILLARKMEAELNRPVIPVFWLAGEDHDFEEVASIHLIDGTQPVTLTYEHDDPAAGKGPVGRLRISDHIETMIREVAGILPQTRNKDTLLESLRTHFQKGRTLTDAFASFLNRLFQNSGLVIVNSDDPRLKKLSAPLFQKETSSPATLTRLLTANTSRLSEHYHAQVTLKPTNLFFLDEGLRIPIDFDENGLVLRDGAAATSQVELRELPNVSPERLSPNVVLRPIMQDVLFPTIAYVGGPGEIAYYAQIKPGYDWAGLPMPVIFPRASLTLIEPTIDKILRRYNWQLLDLKTAPEHLFREYATQALPFDLDELAGDAASQITEALNPLRDAALSIDKSLQRTAASTHTLLQKHIDRFSSRILRAQKRLLEEDKQRIFRARAHLFPAGHLQERTLSPLHFLNLYGLDFFSSLMRDVSLDTTSHQVIRL